MEEIKFRNHYSVVLEKLRGLIVVFLFLILQNLKDAAEMISAFQEWGTTGIGPERLFSMVLILGGLLLFVGGIILINSFVWAKTWFTITPTSIIMERNTISKTKNTIGMKNISNVNLEQSIWGKIIGTCKVKLDTNSLTTANATDIKIVLKKAKAIEIQSLILTRINEQDGQKKNQGIQEHASDDKNEAYDIIAEAKDILLHGICCINIGTVIVLVGCVGSGIAAFSVFHDNITGSIISILANIVILLGIIISCVKRLISGFITYYDFKVGRREDKLHIHYGLLRTIDYTIPVSKVNGVMIHQTLIGRIMKKYMVELINVGMGDEAEEAGSYIILACDRQQLQEQMEQLLPEFALISMDRIKRQPKDILWNKLINTIKYTIILCIAGMASVSLVPTVQGWMAVLACGALIVFGIVLGILQYYTSGIYFDKQQILAANGYFGKRICVMPYENIQYLELKTNILLNRWGIVYGTAHILAATANQNQALPACDAKELEVYVQKYFLKR